MTNWVEELKQLDSRNPGNWPWPFKLGAFLLIILGLLIGAYFAVFQGQQDEIEREVKKTDSLKATFLEKKKLAVNLEAYQQQRTEIEQSFGDLLKRLPNKSEVEGLIVDINQAGLGRGLQFDLFEPAQSESMTEFYAEKPIKIKVTGNYHDLGAFASDVAKLPRIVLLGELKVDKLKDSSLSMEAVAKTYRYLDPEESLAQRKAAADKAKAGGKK